jgi:hypothetical protein
MKNRTARRIRHVWVAGVKACETGTTYVRETNQKRVQQRTFEHAWCLRQLVVKLSEFNGSDQVNTPVSFAPIENTDSSFSHGAS